MTHDELRAELDQLQRRVDDLRAFEREYRARLRAYLQHCLERLDEGSVLDDPR